MEAAAADGLVSKAELLRGVIADKLTTAALEILAAVERTVAGYEEEASGLRQEASGLRQEVDRQRKQLELLLQPEIKREVTDDQFPVCEPAGGGGGGGGGPPEDEEQHKYELSVKDSWSLGLLSLTEAQREEDKGEEEEEEEEERPALSTTQDQEFSTEPDYEAASRKKRGRPRSSELRDHVDLKIRILEDSQIQVLSASVFKKYPVQEVRCSRGLQEADFLDLLRSTFPQLAAQKPFDVFTSDRTKRLHPLRATPLTPEICRSAGHSALYIRLKAPEEERREEERREEERTESSSTGQTTLNTSSATSQHGGRKRRRSGVRPTPSPGDSGAPLSCKVCRTPRRSFNMLIKHSWSHVDDPERRCGVCGERSASADELRTHLQSHQTTHSCGVCGKSFLSLCGLNGHVARHSEKKPHECRVCRKTFALKSSLSNHARIHAGGKTLKCDVCQKTHVTETELTRHMVTHTDERRHPCGARGKSFMRLEHLYRHEWSHAGAGKKSACEICGQTFPTKNKLLLHSRSHCKEKPHVCSICGKRYSYKLALMTHERGHNGL